MDTGTQFNIPTDSSVINQMMKCLQDLQRSAPIYFAELEDANLDIASVPTLVNFLARAPREDIQFFILGKLSMRIQLEALTGRCP